MYMIEMKNSGGELISGLLYNACVLIAGSFDPIDC